MFFLGLKGSFLPSFLPAVGLWVLPQEYVLHSSVTKKEARLLAAREAYGPSGALSHGKTPLASNAGPLGKKPARPGSRNPVGSCSPSVGVSAVCSPGAVDEMGYKPFYAEECASMLAVTFSGGDKLMRSIVSRNPLERLACPSFLSAGGALSLLMPRRIPQVSILLVLPRWAVMGGTDSSCTSFLPEPSWLISSISPAMGRESPR